MSEEWGSWIEHDGLPRPSLLGVVMMVQSECGRVEVGPQNGCITPPPHMTSAWCWAIRILPKHKNYPRITRYRIRKPRALEQLRDLVENLPEGVDA